MGSRSILQLSSRTITILSFVAIFLIALFSQYTTWQAHKPLDLTYWSEQIGYLADHQSQRYVDYGHPGTTVVSAAVVIRLIFGLANDQALLIGLSLLIALGVAWATIIAKQLADGAYWWMAVPVVLLFHHLYPSDTPPSALVAVALTGLVLYVWWLFVERPQRMSHAFFVGAIIGFAASTRIDATLLVATPVLAAYVYSFGWRRVVWVLLAAAIVFFLTDPLLWLRPAIHLRQMLSVMVGLHEVFVVNALPKYSLLVNGGLAGSAVLFGVIVLRRTTSFPRALWMSVFAATALTLIIHLTANFQAIRYFSPIIMVWEVLLAPILWWLVVSVGPEPVPTKARRANWIIPLTIILLVITRFYFFQSSYFRLHL